MSNVSRDGVGDLRLIDAAAALQHLTGEATLTTHAKEQRYYPRVFLAPLLACVMVTVPASKLIRQTIMEGVEDPAVGTDRRALGRELAGRRIAGPAALHSMRRASRGYLAALVG